MKQRADDSFSIMAVNDEYPTEHLNALSGIIVHVSFHQSIIGKADEVGFAE
jgi:hypothetical protein